MPKRTFFDISIAGIDQGRIVFELFSEVCSQNFLQAAGPWRNLTRNGEQDVPKTAENFRALCTGEMGKAKTKDVPLHYKVGQAAQLDVAYCVLSLWLCHVLGFLLTHPPVSPPPPSHPLTVPTSLAGEHVPQDYPEFHVPGR
eukprot:3626499-Rhodomonas_salina.3